MKKFFVIMLALSFFATTTSYAWADQAMLCHMSVMGGFLGPDKDNNSTWDFGGVYIVDLDLDKKKLSQQMVQELKGKGFICRENNRYGGDVHKPAFYHKVKIQDSQMTVTDKGGQSVTISPKKDLVRKIYYPNEE